MKPTYEELELQLEESQREFRAADATIHNLELNLTDMAVQLANSESKCRELAAENVTLNDKMNKLATWPGIEFYSSAWEFCNLDGNDALEFMCDVKTPATDVFLAEVRAQGVDMFGRYHNFSEKLFIQKEAKKFAAQLRKGAAHHCSHCGAIDTCSEHGCTATDQMIERYRASKGVAL